MPRGLEYRLDKIRVDPDEIPPGRRILELARITAKRPPAMPAAIFDDWPPLGYEDRVPKLQQICPEVVVRIPEWDRFPILELADDGARMESLPWEGLQRREIVSFEVSFESRDQALGLKERIETHGLDLAAEVLGLAYDSREVCPGYVFFAIRGTRIDGNRFVPKAVAKGAAAMVSAAPIFENPSRCAVRGARCAVGPGEALAPQTAYRIPHTLPLHPLICDMRRKIGRYTERRIVMITPPMMTRIAGSVGKVRANRRIATANVFVRCFN